MDERTFMEFFRREYPRLVLYVGIRVGPRYSADAAAEAMTTLYRKWNEVVNRPAYVRKVAVGYAVADQQRDEKRAAREAAHQRGAVATARSAEDYAAGAAETQAIMKIIEAMPDRRREVVALAMDGYATKEIAASLGVTEDTVRSHLRHARASLRTQGYGPAGGGS